MPADFLSRNAVDAVGQFDDNWITAQNEDEYCQNLKEQLKNLKDKSDIAKTCFMDDGLLWRRITKFKKQKTVLVAPKSLQKKIITDTHGDMMTGHENTNKTKQRILASYWWPKMEGQIDAHINICEKCQKTRKDSRGSSTFITPLPQCTEPNQRVHMDLFGPLKTTASGKKYIFVITDAFSKYVN